MKFAAALLLATLASCNAATPSFLFILGDDIGWADFSYNNGTAHTPRIKEWTQADGTLVLQDHHTGGTVCSPTRATGHGHVSHVSTQLYMRLTFSARLSEMTRASTRASMGSVMLQ